MFATRGVCRHVASPRSLPLIAPCCPSLPCYPALPCSVTWRTTIVFQWALLVTNLLLFMVWVLLAPSQLSFFIVLSQWLFWYCIFINSIKLDKAAIDGVGLQLPFLCMLIVLYRLFAKSTIPRLSGPDGGGAADLFLLYVLPAFVTLHLNFFAYVLTCP